MACGSRRCFRLALVCVATLLLCGCAALRDYARPTSYDLRGARESYRAMIEGQAVLHQSLGNETQQSARKLVEGDNYLRQGDLQRAVVSYFQAARLDPEQIDPHLRLAYLEIQANPARAEQSFQALAEAEPEDASVWLGLGLARLAQAKLREAEPALVRAVSLRPDSAACHSTLGVLHDRLGRHTEAQEHLWRAIELDPAEVTTLNNLAVSYLLSGDPGRAEELLRTTIQLDPDDTVTRNNLGLAVGLQGRYDEALEIFRQGGDEQSAQNNLGYVYYVAGRDEDAIAIYERALLADGNHPVTVLRNLRRAQRRLQRHLEATAR